MKKSNERHRNTTIYYVIIPVFILIVIFLTAYVMLYNSSRKTEFDDFASEIDVESLSKPDSNNSNDFDIAKYKSYDVYYRSMSTYETISAIILFNESILYKQHVISKRSKSLVLGLAVKTSTLLGIDSNNKSVLAGVNGVVASISPYGDDQYLVSCFNADSVSFEGRVHQSIFIQHKVDYNSVFQYVLPDGSSYALKITEIEYEAKNGYYKMKFAPKTVSKLLLPGSNISVQLRVAFDDCPTYISIEALGNTTYRENDFFNFYAYIDGEYKSRMAYFGRIYGDLVGIYMMYSSFMEIRKIYVEV
ncbi:MAG: hypothetical protein LBF12_05890 [Christensenellaceae bacterium]|jgi:hypothetical protein|nr:hypothetical protein [Christensenellaceae bacterium]